MGIRGVTSIGFAQSNGPTAGRRDVQGFPDLYNLGTLSGRFPGPGDSVPWDYRALLPGHSASQILLNSALEGPSWYEVLWDGISAIGDFSSLVASAAAGNIFGGVEAAAKLYEDVEDFLRDTSDPILYKKSNVLLGYPHPQYDRVTINFDAYSGEQDDPGGAWVVVSPRFSPHDPFAQAVSVLSEPGNERAYHLHASVTIDLSKLRLLLRDSAFGAPGQPASLVVGFAFRENSGTISTSKISHAVCLNLRPLEQRPSRTARTTVYFGGDGVDEKVDEAVLASSQGAGVETPDLFLAKKGDAFLAPNGRRYDEVAVVMEARSPRVVTPGDEPEFLPITVSADVLPVNTTGIAPTIIPSTPAVDSDPFGRLYWTQEAVAKLRFRPEAIGIGSPTTLVLASLFAKPGGATLGVQHQVKVRRALIREGGGTGTGGTGRSGGTS